MILDLRVFMGVLMSGPGHGITDQRESVRPLVAATGEQPDPVVPLARDRAVAVVLDLVNPVTPDRRLVRPGGDARLNEARGLPLGGRGTPQHGRENGKARPGRQGPTILFAFYPSESGTRRKFKG
jgi:hypothetical protein